MPTCNKCKYECDTVKHYKLKTIQNISFYGDNLCSFCFQKQTANYWEYTAYLTIVTRFATENCPDFIKDQFGISIEFIDKSN